MNLKREAHCDGLRDLLLNPHRVFHLATHKGQAALYKSGLIEVLKDHITYGMEDAPIRNM
jgi:hypothetical protein